MMKQSELKKFEVRIAQIAPLASQQWSLWVHCEDHQLPDFQAGQFCMLHFPAWMDPVLPRPYAIVEKKDQMYRFIFRVEGKFTKLLASQSKGARLEMLGPLGLPAPRPSGKKVIVAGGVGLSSLMSLLQETEASDLLFYGVRKDLERIRMEFSAKTLLASDDGSCGFQGRLHELLKAKQDLWQDAAAFYICGPDPMMKACFHVLPKERSYFFLEESMGCGFGICMGCVVQTKNEDFPKKSCVSGPVFRGDELALW